MNGLAVLLKDFARQGRYLYRGIFLAVILGFFFMFWMDNRGRTRERIRDFLHRPWLVAFSMYAGFLFVSTFFARTFTFPYFRVTHNLFFTGRLTADKEIIENTLLYIPYVFFMLKAFCPKRSLTTAFFLAAGTSVFVEISQMVFWLGEFQIADMIYNTAGGLIGWCLWRGFRHLPGKKKREQNSENDYHQ